MSKIKLIIQYQDQYCLERKSHEIDFIHVPEYFRQDAFPNISIFIALLLNGIIDEQYYATVSLREEEWEEKFNFAFDPDYLIEIKKDTFFYNLDQMRGEFPECSETIKEAFKKRPSQLILTTLEELESKDSNMPKGLLEDDIYSYQHSCITVSKELLTSLRHLNIPRTDKDVLLLYSGGKDSTLAAIRLVQMGYKVYFIHFNNGFMMDTDKPYLTWQEIFSSKEDYQFPYTFSDINIQKHFQKFFQEWEKEHGNVVCNNSIHSEIQCLSCRSAMYERAIQVALKHHFHYIAEGARISQKFMIEQLPMIQKFQELAASFGLEVLYPVLFLENDQAEINELLHHGFSSKTWESKCLIGKTAQEKTEQDNQQILNYYETVIRPKIFIKNFWP